MNVHGVGIFMSDAGDDVSAQRICSHIDHIAQLVGPQHIGIGLDWVYDTQALTRMLAIHAGRYEGGSNYDVEFHFAGPDVIPAIADELATRGYAQTDIKGILGGNMMRVFEQVCG